MYNVFVFFVLEQVEAVTVRDLIGRARSWRVLIGRWNS
jgi:hypothetical protein